MDAWDATNGFFIAFEGADATGKSTQARLLAVHLGAVLTREPGGTSVGERIRDLLLDPMSVELDVRAEALLLAAARAQHVAEVIRPSLASDRVVVSERFTPSSLAYQAYGRGLALEEVTELSSWATHGLWPDLIVLLDLPLEAMVARLGAQRDRIEAEADGFHKRVLEGYRLLAAADPARWVVVDAQGTVDDVAGQVRAEVHDRLGKPHARSTGTAEKPL